MPKTWVGLPIQLSVPRMVNRSVPTLAGMVQSPIRCRCVGSAATVGGRPTPIQWMRWSCHRTTPRVPTRRHSGAAEPGLPFSAEVSTNRLWFR